MDSGEGVEGVRGTFSHIPKLQGGTFLGCRRYLVMGLASNA